MAPQKQIIKQPNSMFTVIDELKELQNMRMLKVLQNIDISHQAENFKVQFTFILTTYINRLITI
jgi:hypothetical protein